MLAFWQDPSPLRDWAKCKKSPINAFYVQKGADTEYLRSLAEAKTAHNG